jgi:hypothetical protein
MAEVKQNASVRVFVRLVDVGDRYTPITGKTGADATVTFAKGDGTTANYAGSATLTELSAGAYSGAGIYQLTVPTAVTDVLGPLGYIISVSGAEKFPGEPLDVVANTAADNYTRLGAPAGASHAADVAAVKSAVDTNATNVTAVKAKTDNLPGDPASQATTGTAITSAVSTLATSSALTTVGTSVTAIKAKTDNLPASPANETTLAAVKTKTDALPSDPADESLLEAAVAAVASSVTSVSGKADTLLKAALNRRAVFTSGGDAFREVLFDDDGTSALHKWDLKGEAGAPTAGPTILDKVPVP